jgi:hypothetical protein
VENIKINLRGIGWNGAKWMDISQEWRALENTVLNLRVP